MPETKTAGTAPVARCRDCNVELQSRTAAYCILCYGLRQRLCGTCCGPDSKLLLKFKRGPNHGDPPPVCPACGNSRVVLDDAPAKYQPPPPANPMTSAERGKKTARELAKLHANDGPEKPSGDNGAAHGKLCNRCNAAYPADLGKCPACGCPEFRSGKYPPPKAYGFDLVVSRNGGLPDERCHYAGTEAACRKKAMLRHNASAVLSCEPLTEEQYLRAYGRARRK